MQEILSKKFLKYTRENHPDLAHALQEENKLHEFLQNHISTIEPLLLQLISQNKPSYIIEEICMEQLISSPPPSRLNYIKSIVEEKHPEKFEALKRNGILDLELLNMLAFCLPLFEAFNFSQFSEEDQCLCYVITRAIKEYIKESERENVKPWPGTFIIS